MKKPKQTKIFQKITSTIAMLDAAVLLWKLLKLLCRPLLLGNLLFDLYRKLTLPISTSINLSYDELTILKVGEFIDKTLINQTVLRYSYMHLYYNVTSLSNDIPLIQKLQILGVGDVTSSLNLTT